MGLAADAKVLTSRHDVELAALAAAGDRGAFDELVRRHGAAVRGLLRRMGVAEAEADRFALEVFLVAFEQIGGLRGHGAFSAWIRKLAARLWLRRRRRQALALMAVQTLEPAGEEHGSGLSDQALAALPSCERLCVVLCHGAGLGPGELAESLGLPAQAAGAALALGLGRLRACLGPPLAESDFDPLLQALFAQPLALSDGEAFRRRVSLRLDRAWALRRALIGGLGLLGGLIAVGQLTASRFLGHAEVISVQSFHLMSIAMAEHVPWRLLLASSPFGGAILWGAAALALLGVGLIAARLFRDI